MIHLRLLVNTLSLFRVPVGTKGCSLLNKGGHRRSRYVANRISFVLYSRPRVLPQMPVVLPSYPVIVLQIPDIKKCSLLMNPWTQTLQRSHPKESVVCLEKIRGIYSVRVRRIDASLFRNTTYTTYSTLATSYDPTLNIHQRGFRYYQRR